MIIILIFCSYIGQDWSNYQKFKLTNTAINEYNLIKVDLNYLKSESKQCE